MNGDMAERAGLILCGLIVETRRSGRSGSCRLRVTTNAEEIYLILHEQALIGGTVGRMTDRTTLEFRFVLINEGTLFLGVALVANLVPRSIRPQLLWPECPVRAVTIVALNQPFIDTVMKRPGKLGLHVHVARVTKLRGFRFHQELAFLGMVRRMAIDAGHAVREMHGTVVVAVFLGVLVAPQAASAGFLRRAALEREDFRFVPTAIHVLFARAMARFTTVPFRAFVRGQL
jgi:hypothetical protein